MNFMRLLHLNLLLCSASLFCSADRPPQIVCSKDSRGYGAQMLFKTESGATVVAQVRILNSNGYAEYMVMPQKGFTYYQRDPAQAIDEAKALDPSLSQDDIDLIQAFFDTANSIEAIEKEIELQEKKRQEKVYLLNFAQAWAQIERYMHEAREHYRQRSYEADLKPPGRQ